MAGAINPLKLKVMKKNFNFAIVNSSHHFAQPFNTREEAEKAILEIKETEEIWSDKVRLIHVDGRLVRLTVYYGVHCWMYDIKSYKQLIYYKNYYPNLF